MSSFLVQAGGIFSLQTWFALVNEKVDEPYLDEVFHIRQAQVYCKGNFHQWDPKITTPPGLYYISYFANQYLGVPCSAGNLRLTSWALVVLFILPLTSLLLSSWPVAAASSLIEREDGGNSSKSRISASRANRRTALVYGFPVLAFFSALYYTDVASTTSVLLYFNAHQFRNHRLPNFFGDILLYSLALISLFFRQTNIFWVGVYPAILDVIEILKGLDKSTSSTYDQSYSSYREVIVKSWQLSALYDPTLRDAALEDYLKSVISFTVGSIANARTVIRRTLPHIFVINTFSFFVIVNGGVVLGDKSNHVTTLHLLQLLYMWPFILFFSWPRVTCSLMRQVLTVDLSSAASSKKADTNRDALRLLKSIRIWPEILFLVLSLAAVHWNTIIHPFTLADNRHYVFYVFKLLRKHPALKYIAVPLYLLSARMVIQALCLPEPTSEARRRLQKVKAEDKATPQHKKTSTAERKRPAWSLRNCEQTTCLMFLAWLGTCGFCLCTTPLFEPRYLIVPWITWRLQVPSFAVSPSLEYDHATTSSKVTNTKKEVQASPAQSKKVVDPKKSKIRSRALSLLANEDTALYLELLWFLIVNAGTMYMFLYRGFQWRQEPGRTQRFMW